MLLPLFLLVICPCVVRGIDYSSLTAFTDNGGEKGVFVKLVDLSGKADAIVEAHNQWRATRRATNMQKMVLGSIHFIQRMSNSE